MARPPEKTKSLPSQENLLLDYVRRLEKHKDGRKMAHIHLSALRPFNRRDQHVRAASNSFEPLVKDMIGQLFHLDNSDLIFIFKGTALAQVQTIVQKIRFLFSDDPLMEADDADEQFCGWYDADGQFNEILAVAQNFADVQGRRETETRGRQVGARAALKAKQEKGEPLTPAILGKVVDALRRADLSNLVRRQFICSIDKKLVPEQVFSELFISISDLRETLLPNVNLLANRWLFQYLTETLDRRMLSMLTKTDRITISGDISFNLNVSTMVSQDFLDFDDAVPASRRGAMIIELQKLDIFADISSYLFAREFVQEKGYRICLDGLTHETMAMLDRERIGADLIKVVWHPELVDGGEDMRARVHGLIDRTGADRVILCRVDNREAVDFGHSMGISLFQGRHVEKLIAEDNRRREMLRLKRRIERDAEGPEE